MSGARARTSENRRRKGRSGRRPASEKVEGEKRSRVGPTATRPLPLWRLLSSLACGGARSELPDGPCSALLRPPSSWKFALRFAPARIAVVVKAPLSPPISRPPSFHHHGGLSYAMPALPLAEENHPITSSSCLQLVSGLDSGLGAASACSPVALVPFCPFPDVQHVTVTFQAACFATCCPSGLCGQNTCNVDIRTSHRPPDPYLPLKKLPPSQSPRPASHKSFENASLAMRAMACTRACGPLNLP